MPGQEHPDGLPAPRRYGAVTATWLGSAVSSFDNGFVNVALPTISLELGVKPSATVLVVTVFQLMLMMTVLPFSSLGDRIGLRRMYQSGQTLFAAAALLCVFAKSLPFLIVVRGVMGLGASMINSVNSAMIRLIYPRDQLGRGLAYNTLVSATSATAGPVIGGLLLAEVHWSWLFAALVPLLAVSLLAGQRSLPDPEPHDEPFDLKSAGLCAAMFGLFVAGIQMGVHGGPLLMAIAIAALALPIGLIFIRRELVQANPVLPVDLLRDKLIALPLCASFLTHLSTTSLLLTLPFRLQHAYGYSTAKVGVAIMAWSLTMAVVAPLSGAMADRYRPGLQGSLGMGIALAGTISLALLPERPELVDLAWRFALAGCGYGLFYSPNSRQIIDAAPRRRIAAAGGIMQTFRLSGQLLGSTLAALWLALNLGDGKAPPLTCAAFAAITGILCLLVLGASGEDKPSR